MDGIGGKAQALARAHDVRGGAVTVDASIMDSACLGFERAAAELSARRPLTMPQALAFAALMLGAAGAWYAAPALATRGAHITLFVYFAGVIGLRLAASLTPAEHKARLYATKSSAWPVYTVLCPVYREAAVVADLIAALERIDYPKHALDIQILVESDDVDTVLAALGAARGAHIRVVQLAPATPRTKPKALNVGLAHARGDYLVIYDAEDRPHPQQLRAALAEFARHDDRLVCVQAPLVIDNADTSWIARQFAAEYAIQFGQMLPFLSRWNLPVALGGTSNHFRVDALRALHGWDPHNVTEDADLGYRIARARLRTGMIALPTWEEAPTTRKAWLTQRTRWLKGYMQTWLVLMRAPGRLVRELGLRNFLVLQLTLGGAIVSALAHGPLALGLLATMAWRPGLLAPIDLGLAACGYGAAFIAAAVAARRSGERAHLRGALTMAFYWPLATLAALRALASLIVAPHSWHKTEHGLAARAPQAHPIRMGHAPRRTLQ